jgi:hypothetical protein
LGIRHEDTRPPRTPDLTAEVIVSDDDDDN